MQEKITFSQLCSLVSTRTSVSRKATEEYLRAFFSAISDALEHSDSVKIKGLGTFKITGIAERRSVNVTSGQDMVIPAHNRITFTPAPAMAQAVNVPFSAFEAVELADDFTDADLAALDAPEQPQAPVPAPERLPEEPKADEEVEVSAPVLSEPDKSEVDDEEVFFEEIVPSPAPVSEPLPAPELATTPVPPPAPEPVPEPTPVFHSTHRSPLTTFWGGFCSALAFVAIVCGVIVLCWPNILKIAPWHIQPEYKPESAINKTGAQQAAAESVQYSEQDEKQNLNPVTEPGEEAQSDGEQDSTEELVYDTISKTRYLTTMAKEHYGNYHFWPYIYEENKAILGHPDRIKPGTRVVVPPLSKYGVDPSNPDDVREAKRKGVAIYSRYQK